MLHPPLAGGGRAVPEGRRTQPHPQIGPVAPVQQVMPALVARTRKVGDLVQAVAVGFQEILAQAVQGDHRRLVGQLQPTPAGLPIKQGAGLQGEAVHRKVLGFQGHGPAQARLQVPGCLPGQAEDQVQVQVLKAGPAGPVHGLFHLPGCMGAAQEPEFRIQAALGTDA